MSAVEYDELDGAFSRLIERMATGHADLARQVALQVSRAVAGGSTCIELREVAPESSVPDLHAALLASGVVGAPGAFLPLILDGDDRLYLQRYHDLESRLESSLRERAARTINVEPAGLEAALDRHFSVSDPDDRQRHAAVTAARRGLCIVSGGPGTGKTTTVVRILALLRELAAGDELRVALAAPTGKAAARLQESVRDASLEASTLHRLLGVVPHATRFRHGPDHPLPVDVLVVDEASMVDLALMTRTVEALRPDARLILLGDRDQLFSVEAGSVLADLCADPASSVLRESIVLLTRNYRFDAASGIGRLARAIRDADSDEAVEVLRGDVPDVSLAPMPVRATELAALAEHGYRPYLEAVRRREGPSAALRALGSFRILSPFRRSQAAVEAALRGSGVIPREGAWYDGRPVMVRANDHALGLYNGDVGIALREAEDRVARVHFDAADGATRAYSTARLPENDTAWAMTVHKSQGSEFDHVAVLLPDVDSPILTRELLYTAVTRARRSVTIHGSPDTIAATIGRSVRRMSGMRFTRENAS